MLNKYGHHTEGIKEATLLCISS